ncbi:peptide chain release factor 1 [Ruficoccus amylovorans]|uniref:Peptide chain release factor 1 n=1 Tax=Ruficoccus amylovorans TaxID=1804625 RepID=A0A842HBB1_9BACT|nr:peptide chain release factor 1 [Ruficoccus amylovorans]MBC2593695.1 peptide chain release factor 1 [Ruficoccus amylovorans]
MEGIPDIAPFRNRKEELDAKMAEPDFFSDQRRAAELSREHTRLSGIVALYDAADKLEADLAGNRVIIDDPETDPELKELAAEEIAGLEEQVAQKRDELLLAMLPPDPSDSRNTIVEIRAGAGGDEASLFAGDLTRMYHRFADQRGWTVEPMGASESDAGGFKEISFLITGDDVYKVLKYESGVHRVQRVPVTEASGRIHTSTATVAVLPEAEEVDIEIKTEDLEITTTRASGAGGQHVNTTDSAVQMTHKPTGLTVYCADERSQHKNRAKALTVLRSRLLEQKQREEQEKYAANRRSQIGTGDRSERIRTYNFPQNRLTDHRIGLSLSLPQVMEGDLDDLVEALRRADLQARLDAMNK